MQTIRSLLLLIALLQLTNSHAHPVEYYAKPISGKVVDYATKRPLEGVIVVAHWELFETGVGHAPGHVGEMLKVIEVTTDQDGRYHIPGWGPLRRPSNKHLYNHDPELVFFRSGFYLEARRSVLRSNPSTENVRTSIWDGETIELLPFSGQPQEYTFWDGQVTVKVPISGTREEYAARLGFFGSALDKNWKLLPRMTRALQRELQELKRAGLKEGDAPYIPDAKALVGNSR